MDSNDDHSLSGIWQCKHWYPTKDDSAQETSTHTMRAHQHGNTLVLQSLPDGEDSYLLVHLTIDGNVAMGSWHETSREDGEFEGAEYSGAGQLILNEGRNKMEGMWSGAGFDHKLNRLRVYTDKWEIARTSE